jgi:hypothetical protein
MIARQSPAKAVTTVAHKIARLVYGLLRNGQAHVTRRIETAEKKSTLAKITGMAKAAARMGLVVAFPSD